MHPLLMQGDCLELMQLLPDASIDSVITDPPYHLTSNKKGGSGPASVNLESPHGRARVTTGFMGMTWDGGDIAFSVELWREALRVLKPGAHLLAFSGTRTYHRMAVAIEDAGFEIRDQIGWLYGSGFPKSRDFSRFDMTAEDGERWAGWGTALKPAWEPICVARKPLVGTVAENVLSHGTGALNIDNCRVPASKVTGLGGSGSKLYEGGLSKEGGNPRPAAGRWPANIIHDGSDEVRAAFPQAPGQMARARTDGEAQGNKTYGALNHVTTQPEPRLDTGSAARFFYCAKASKRDRDEGCDGLTAVKTNDGRAVDADNAYQRGATERKNSHPTVKPTELMAYLCRLVTPPGGVVLDPFMGSGSTGKACAAEGFYFVGTERDESYFKIAKERVESAYKLAKQNDK